MVLYVSSMVSHVADEPSNVGTGSAQVMVFRKKVYELKKMTEYDEKRAFYMAVASGWEGKPASCTRGSRTWERFRVGKKESTPARNK